MMFGRKLVLWTPESTQKAYIEHPTQFGHIFQKAKKIAFLTIKIDVKNFLGRIFRPMWTGHQSNTRDQYTTYVPPNPYNLEVWTLALLTYMYPQKFAFICKKALF